MDDDFEIEVFDASEYDWNVAIPSGGYTITLGPYEMKCPPDQPDLFRHYVTSQWLHGSHLADEDPQYQCEAWIKSQPHLSEAWCEGKIEIKHNSDDGVDYYYTGEPDEFVFWKLRWSEMFDA